MSREAIVAAHERERQSVQLFIRGLSWFKIGRNVSMSARDAQKAFERALKRIPPKDVDVLRKLQRNLHDAASEVPKFQGR